MFIINQSPVTSNFHIFILNEMNYWVIVKKTKIINDIPSGKLGSGIFYTTIFE